MRAIKQRDRDALKSKHSSSNDSSSSSLKMSDSRSSLDKSDVNVFQFKGQQFNNNNGDGMNQVEEDHFKRLQSEWNHLEKSRTTSPTFFNGASVRDKTDKEIRLESPSRSHSSLSFYVGDTTDNFGGHTSRTSNKIETDHSSRGLFSSDKYKMTNREWNHVDVNHLEDVTLADDVRSRSFTSNALNKSQHRQDLADDRDHSTLTKVHHHRRQQQLPERSFHISDYDSHQSHKSDEPKIEVSVGEVSFNGFKVSPSSTRTAHNIPLKGILKESFSEQKKFVSDHRTENEESRVTIIPSSLGKQQHFQRFDDLHLGERSSNFQTIPFNDTCIVHSRDKISIKNNGSISPERNLNNQYVLTISISSDGTIGNSFLNNGVNRRSTS